MAVVDSAVEVVAVAADLCAPSAPSPSPVLVPATSHSFSEFVMMLRCSLQYTLRSVAAIALIAPTAFAQDSTVVANKVIPVRQLGPVEARTAESLGNINTLRALPNGSVFVNDGSRRQILLFDDALKVSKVVADTIEAPLPYGQRNAGLLPYMGDSTIMVDPASLALLVLNERGDLVRVMAPPRTQDINFLASANLGSHAFDTNGHLIYRLNQPGAGMNLGGGFGGGDRGGDRARGGAPGGQQAPGGRGGAAAGTPPAAQGAQAGRGATPPAQPNAAEIRRQVQAVAEDRFPAGNSAQITVNGERRTRSFNQRNLPDSVPILRANFDTRKVDTVTFMRVTNPKFEMKTTEDGGTQVNVKMNPLPQNDDWALMADGTVAVVRVLDYRIDWFKPDGTLERTAPLPFDWKRITDDEKTKMVDSLKLAAKIATEQAQQMMGGPRGFRPGFEPVEAEFLPDYYPPIRAGTTLADHDGNLWLLPATSSLAAQMTAMVPPQARGRMGMPTAANAVGLAYDVVNRKGEIVERVQLPAGRTIAGFGPNGVVYLMERKGREVFLEKARRQ